MTEESGQAMAEEPGEGQDSSRDYWFGVAIERGRALNETRAKLEQMTEANRVLQESNSLQGLTIDQLRDVILRLAIAQSGVKVRAMDVQTQMMRVEVSMTAEAARMFSLPESLAARHADPKTKDEVPKGYWHFWHEIGEKVRGSVTQAVLDSEFGRDLRGMWKEVQE